MAGAEMRSPNLFFAAAGQFASPSYPVSYTDGSAASMAPLMPPLRRQVMLD